MKPCDPGPDVMRPLTDAERGELLTDLHTTPGVRCLETEQAKAPPLPGGVVYKARVRPLPGPVVERHGSTMDEALRALHRATAYLRPEPTTACNGRDAQGGAR